MESTSQNNNINAIKEVRKLFNDVRNNLFNEETKRIRKKLHKKEADCTFLKGKEQEGKQLFKTNPVFFKNNWRREN